MTQFALPSLNAAVDDGITLSTKFNGAMGALYSSHAGSAAPPSPVKGQVWVDTSLEAAATPVLVIRAYTGTVWRALGTLDLTSGLYTTAGGLPLTGGTVTGPILFPTGTVAAPSMSFAGDTDTGIYRISADQLGFTLAGVQRLSLTAAEAVIASNQLTYRPPGVVSPIFNIDRTNAGSSNLRFTVNNSSRWSWQMTTAEAGANSGSNMNFQLFNDDGSLLVNMLQFMRSSRQLGINGGVIGSATLTIRTSAAALGEDALEMMNVHTDLSAWVGLNFRTAGGALRGAVRGVRPGNNNGDVEIHSATSGVLNLAATFRSNGNLDVVGAITSAGAAVTSSATLKKQINDAPSQLALVNRLRVVTFQRDVGEDCPPPRDEMGFIAEEVAKVLPDAVTEGDKAIHLMDVIASLTKAVQELSAKVQILENRK